ncbi:hypothetical protein ACGFX2_31790 [Streptomyces goshikiensis]
MHKQLAAVAVGLGAALGALCAAAPAHAHEPSVVDRGNGMILKP